MPATSADPVLVTGGTGLLGSHIAERLIALGHVVRSLVRPGSDTRFLDSLGVELISGDLTDRAACNRATRGVDRIFHAAAKVGDWGSWQDFKTGCLDATTHLADAALSNGVSRFVHISSTSAYGHPTEGGLPVAENAPLGQNLWPCWDYYTRSKVESERLLWDRIGRGLKLTVLRPSWLYGERDRTTATRLIERIRREGVPLIGPGSNPISAIYAGNVADAAIHAAYHPRAVGEAFNVTDQGPITQKDYLNLWAAACGMPPIHKHRRYRMVFAGAFLLEAYSRLTGKRKPPLITRYATWLMGRQLAYSNVKIEQTLGWTPKEGYRATIERTVAWYFDHQPQRTSLAHAVTIGTVSPNSL